MCVGMSVCESWEKTGERESESERQREREGERERERERERGRERGSVCVVCGISMEIDESNEHVSRQQFAGSLSVIYSYAHK